MYRENNIESNVKWFLFGTAGLSSLCQIIMLFTEVRLFYGITMFLNVVYHLVCIACPIVIGYLVFKRNEDMKIYTGYLLSIQCVFLVLANLCITITYLVKMNNLYEPKSWIVGIGIVLMLIEFFEIFVFWKYGQDKITCITIILTLLVASIFNGVFYSCFDSSIGPFLNKTINASEPIYLFSIWMFLHLLFMISLVICIALYMDNDFLIDVFHNPNDLFSKKTFIVIEEKNSSEYMINNNTVTAQYNAYTSTGGVSYQPNVQQPTLEKNTRSIIGVCPECGKELYQNQKMCYGCGCPVELAVYNDTRFIVSSNTMNNSSQVENTVPRNMNNITQTSNNMIQIPVDSNRISYGLSNEGDFSNNTSMEASVEKMICPDCGGEVFSNQDACPMCGSPRIGFIKNTVKEQLFNMEKEKSELEIKAKKICPDCGSEVEDGATMCNKCGCPL